MIYSISIFVNTLKYLGRIYYLNMKNNPIHILSLNPKHKKEAYQSFPIQPHLTLKNDSKPLLSQTATQSHSHQKNSIICDTVPPD